MKKLLNAGNIFLLWTALWVTYMAVSALRDPEGFMHLFSRLWWQTGLILIGTFVYAPLWAMLVVIKGLLVL